MELEKERVGLSVGENEEEGEDDGQRELESDEVCDPVALRETVPSDE